ncbi:MAG: flagellar hook-associated protein FlgK, partial [Bacteroidota bacterium]
SRLSGYEADTEILTKLESILAEPSELGLNNVVNEFLQSFNDLSSKPEDIGYREHTIELAKTMAERFNITSRQISQTRDDVLADLKVRVDNANALIKKIAGLNDNISRISASSNKAQTYIDERALALEELSKLGNVTISEEKDGSLNVHMEGINIVSGKNHSELSIMESVDSGTGEKSIQLAASATNGEVILNPMHGELKSLLKHYNVTLDGLDSSGEYSVATKINDLAAALANEVNAIISTGYGLDDTGAVPPGRNFFEPALGNITAENISVSDDVLLSARDLPLASVTGEPGNNDIARQIAAIISDTGFLNNETPAGYYTNMVGKIGKMKADAESGVKTMGLVSGQLESQRESIMGVNLDEEAVNLIKFQKAFEASSRVVNITNEILGTIVNLGR